MSDVELNQIVGDL